MDTAIQTYIETVQVNDIPWHRLTTTYGRATDFPEALDVLWNMESIETVDAAGEALELNIEHQSTLWHATPFAMIFLLRIFKKAQEEVVFPDDLFFSFYYYSLQVLLLAIPLLDTSDEGEAKLLGIISANRSV
ncbi:MAG: hypothetical protein E7H41_02870 [Veillonella sp.]|uniref:hypothetical protein n=1 Tax=Veillonella sp. TaxID=1926307 RepID=UPI00291BF022|nr:hypothetical protein [Veillonella sp.]MDU8949199.1 hypothetical protein [Veillonella sp.]